MLTGATCRGSGMRTSRLWRRPLSTLSSRDSAGAISPFASNTRDSRKNVWKWLTNGARPLIERRRSRPKEARSSCLRHTRRCRRSARCFIAPVPQWRSGKIELMDLRIGHLYPDLMNIYGDRGNVIALAQRAKWRGIQVEVRPYSGGPWADPGWADVWFFGGGQDQGQDIVGADLAGKNGAALRRSVEGGAAIFSVCGGYQLLGHEYVPETGPSIPGVGILDVTTHAGKTRFVGNLLVNAPEAYLIGFENHSGRTHLGSSAKPLGTVVVGHGNNGEDKTEGAVQGKVIGCYLHGSCLPKNPWLADRLLGWALARRHNDLKLAPLDDAAVKSARDQPTEDARTRAYRAAGPGYQ